MSHPVLPGSPNIGLPGSIEGPVPGYPTRPEGDPAPAAPPRVDPDPIDPPRVDPTVPSLPREPPPGIDDDPTVVPGVSQPV